jgi:hypothetical protein
VSLKILGVTALSALALGVAFRCALGCSDDTVVETDAASPPGGSDGAPRSDSSLDDATEAGGDGQTLVTDAGAISWDGRAPLAHRDASVACPRERDHDASLPCPEGTPPPGSQCVTNADCTGGQNGRCLCAPSFDPPDTGTVCSYDQCFADTDCPPRVPCGCRDVNIYGNPNTCNSASNCAVDSDCPSTGFCSQSGGAGYYCHTPNDACIDDVGCPPATFMNLSACLFDGSRGVWRCFQVPQRL